MENLDLLYAGYDIHKGCTDKHSHRGWEILYVIDGAFNINFSGQESIECSAGDLLILAPHVAHERVNLAKTKTYFAVFEVDNPQWESPVLVHTGKDRLLERWLHDISELHKSNIPEQAVTLLQAVIQRIEYLMPKQDAIAGFHPAVRRSCQFMSEHFSENITIADVAKESSVSQSHLNLLFRDCLDMTPLQYLRMVRMQAARQLLLNPFCNISEIASMCGFEDMHYFTRAFKKFHGVPPGVFRNDPGKYADTENVTNV